MPLFILLWVIATNTHAQINNRNFNNSGTFSGLTMSIHEIKPESGVRQNHYYFMNQWYPAVLFTENGDTIEIKEVRYDIYQNRLEFKRHSVTFVLDFNKLRQFTLASKNGIHVFYIDQSQNECYEVLEEGPYKLLLYNKIIVKKPDYNLALNVGSRDETLTENQEYYLRTPENRLILIKGNRKKFANQLNNEKLKKFILTNKLNLSNLSDLKQMVNHATKVSSD